MPISLGTSHPAQALQSGAAKLWVLLVGVNHYQEADLPSLQYPAPDCQGLAQALNQATQAFPSKELCIYHDFADQMPTVNAVRKRLQAIAQAAQSQDTLLIYFSGHGLFDPQTEQVVLCLSDTQKSHLYDSGLPMQELLQTLGSSLARQQLVWLDACHSGGLTLRGTVSGAKGTAIETATAMPPNPTSRLVEVLRHRAAQGQGFYALLSCDRTQRSWEFPELGHGVFTYYLMRGLRGEAADAQGVIDADGLYKYVYHQTLRYIDKANQQIRLVNRQRKSKGETSLTSEYPLQTPKRIVEGMGEIVLGMRPQQASPQPRRRALIVDGLRSYQTTLALSKTLQNMGQYSIDYWPQPGKAWENVKAAIATCLNSAPTEADGQLPTVLLYLRGILEESPEGSTWLVLGDGVRLYRSWLRQTLRQARNTRQLVVLDCPRTVGQRDYLGADPLQDWIEDLQIEADRGQCIIAAASLPTEPEQFAQALLETLKAADVQIGLPVAAWIAQLQLHLAGTPLAQAASEVQPLSWLSGTQGVIEVVPNQVGIQASQRADSFDLGVCPYMGLRAFGLEQSQYFYGREALTQQLIERLRHEPALAVVGASGSGKSSVLQAGVLGQLYQGKQIPGSEQWWIRATRPGATPLKALAQRLVDSGTERERAYQAMQIEAMLYQGSDGFVEWLRSRPEPLVLLVIDQFEELFTLAAASDRQPFLDLLLEAVHYAGDRFKLILSVRADFLPNCLEHSALATLLQTNSVLVPPRLTPEAYRDAILKPADQVGLQIEPGLVDLLLQEVNQAAGELPLLEFVLEKLWENRKAGKLTLTAYQQLGGLRGALERQAQAVYDSLDATSQECARWIFLALTQLGDGTEDTRRRVLKSDLVVAKYPAALVDETLRVLTAAKLVVIRADDMAPVGYSRGNLDDDTDVDEDIENERVDEAALPLLPIAPMEPTVEVVHESLIRHWSTLRWWLAENRARLQLQRQLSQQAAAWQQTQQVSGQQATDFLLTGGRLADAEDLYIKYTDELSETVQRFIEMGLEARQQRQVQAKRRLKRARVAAGVMGGLGAFALALGSLAYRQTITVQLQKIEALNVSSEALLWSYQPLKSLQQGISAARQLQEIGWIQRQLADRSRWQTLRLQTAATLQQSLSFGQMINQLEGHYQAVNAVQFSGGAGQRLVSAGDDGSVIIWRRDGSQVASLFPGTATTDVGFVSESSGLTTLAIATSTGEIQLWDVDEQGAIALQDTLSGHQDWVTGVAVSPDGELLVSGSRDRTLKLWRKDGTLVKTVTGHSGWVNSVRFSPDGQTLATTSEDKTIRLWTRDGTPINTLSGHSDRTTDATFSPDGKTLASTSADGTLRLWSLPTGTLKYKIAQAETDAPISANQLNTVAFSPDGKTLAVGQFDATVQLWRVEDGLKLDTLTGHIGSVTDLSFDPNGLLASASADATVRLWAIRPLDPLADMSISSISVSPIASASNQLFATADFTGEVVLWQQNSQKAPTPVRTLSRHEGGVQAIAFNPAGTQVASAGVEGQITVSRVADGTQIATTKGHENRVTSIAFSPDGQQLVTGSADKTIRLWALADNSLTLIETLTGHTDEVTSVRFHPQRPLLVSGSYDSTVRLWQLSQKSGVTLVQTLDSANAGISEVQFSPKGDRIAASSWDSRLYVWQLRGQSAQPHNTLGPHDGGVSSVIFSGDGRALLTSSGNGTVTVWDAERGQRIKQVLSRQNNGPGALALSADSELLVGGAVQGGLSLWNWDLSVLLGESCDRLGSYLLTNSSLSPEARALCR